MKGIALEQQQRIVIRDVGVAAERHRCVGLLLAEVGRQRLAGNREMADRLDALALEMEHPEMLW